METPFAHLEDIQMKLDLEIFPPRGAASKAWSCPSPTTQPLRGGRQSILHLQAAVGKMAWAQAMQWYPWVLTVLLFYCCCVLYPRPFCKTLHLFLASCYARPWAGHQTHAEMHQTQPLSPRRDQGLEEDAETANKDRCLRERLRKPRGRPLTQPWGGRGQGRRWEDAEHWWLD